MKKLSGFILLGALLASSFSFALLSNNVHNKVQETNAATAVSTYYNSVNGTGSSLLSSLNNKIKLSSWVGYDNLKAAYAYTDVRADGKIYDLYSDVTNYVPGSNFAGSYTNPGDGYNREHVIPQSWWNKGTAKQGCDLFIVLPSDAKINGVRDNNPYGITTSGKVWKVTGDTFENRCGDSTNTSYVSGTVFEPFDNRKGDIARIYFYAVAAYLTGGEGYGAVTNWTGGEGSSVFSSTGNNGFVQNYLNLLLKWHKEDPVSQWEINRNNNVEDRQGNRNPFVDHPSWVDLIWGGTYPSSGLNYENTNNGTATVVNGQISGASNNPSATISPSTPSVQVGNTVNLTATLSNVTNANNITWTSSDETKATVVKGTTSTTSSIATVTGGAAGNPTIYCKHSGTTIGSVTVSVTSSGGGNTISASKSVSDYATANSWSNGTKYTSLAIDNVATASVGNGAGNTGKYYTTGNEWRFYQTESATIVISVSNGYLLDKITFTYNIDNTGVLKNSSSQTVSSAVEQTVSGSSVTFSVGNSGNATNGQVKFTAFSVSYHLSSLPVPTVTSVTIDPDSLELDLNGETTGELEATVSGTNNPAQTVTWESDDETVATVDEDGVVTAVAIGTATIKATSTVDDTKYGECSVSVVDTTPTSEPITTGTHSFKKITTTDDLKSGTYMIVCEHSSVALDGSLTTIDAASNNQSISISSSKFDLSVSYCVRIVKGNSNCTIQTSSGYYIGKTADSNGLNSNTSTQYTNTISFDDGNANIVGSGGAYLRYNSASDQKRFRYYASDKYTGQKAIQLYRMEDEKYAEYFLNSITCNNNGASAPTISPSWSSLGTEYSNLSDTSKSYFTGGSPNKSGTVVEQAIARYDLLVRKYKYNNFMSRTFTGSNILTPITKNETNIVLIVTLMSILSVSAIFLVFIKKKRQL